MNKNSTGRLKFSCILIILCCLLCLFLAACGKKSTDAAQGKTEAVDAAQGKTVTDDLENVGEVIEPESSSDDIGVTVEPEPVLSLPDSAAVNLEMILGEENFSDNVDYFKIWLSDSLKHCSIVINDPKKKYFSMNPQISGSYKAEEALPYERFLSLIDSYGYFKLNEKGEKTEGSPENISIRITFENGQTYSYTSNVLPEKYEEFKKEYVNLLVETYREFENRK